ncbi:unnamed protein product, partial [Rotaria sp. Silwood1]
MQYKNILIVLSIYLTLALNSAECEHGYSIANRIQINGRSRLMIETLDALMNVRMLLFPDDVRRTLRKQLNSYVMYLLAASITNWVLINTSLISSLYDVDHIDPQNTSLIVCKLRMYGSHMLLMLSRSFTIAACIDRLVLTSSSARIRSLSQPKVARDVIIFLMLIWPIIPV